MPHALIVGHAGQDGRLLWDQLAARGFSLTGLGRGTARSHESAGTAAVDVGDAAAVERLLATLRPDQVYYLAAHHHSSQDAIPEEAALWRASQAVHVDGWFNVLDAARRVTPATRLFYASSSRVFGDAAAGRQDEDSPLRPTCFYGITKMAGMRLAEYFRRRHGLHVACGILFNHESPLRGRQFVSQRIAHGLAALKTGRAQTLRFGDLQARIDWGWAPDYTRAMTLMLESAPPGDYVVATGETHSVREMIERAAGAIDVEWQGRVLESPDILRRAPQALSGDASRLRAATGWSPSVDFAGMVQRLAEAALADPREV